MSTVIPRDQAISEIGAMIAAERLAQAEAYQAGGAEAVARRARPDGSPEEIAALAGLYEGWVQSERLRRAPGAGS